MTGWELAPITWEAVAGFTAVAAAAWAASRAAGIAEGQRNIQRGQKDIQARQVHLGELKLRSDLFDRRFAVYEDTRRFLSAILTEGAPPSQEREHAFLVASERSRFLFRPQVYTDLNEVWRKASSYRAAWSVAKANPSQEHLDAESELFEWLANRGLSLHELFGEELRLASDPPTD